MSELTWGASVRVKSTAPAQMRPEALAEVVGLRRVETRQQAEQFDAPMGSPVYLIEFADGEAIELSEKWLDAL